MTASWQSIGLRTFGLHGEIETNLPRPVSVHAAVAGDDGVGNIDSRTMPFAHALSVVAAKRCAAIGWEGTATGLLATDDEHDGKDGGCCEAPPLEVGLA